MGARFGGWMLAAAWLGGLAGCGFEGEVHGGVPANPAPPAPPPPPARLVAQAVPLTVPPSSVCPADGPCLPPLARHGRVRLSGNTLVDDDGPFVALGATMMWGAWGYRHDRAKLEQALAQLRDAGFHYVRALGVVGHPTQPDYWDGREIDWRWPDYAQVIAGFTDLAYDRYGLRVQWTLIGDGQLNIPGRADRFALADTFLAMSQGREHKLMLFETANEAWQNGFEGDSGLTELRDLTKYLNDRTEVLVAASAPAGHECADTQAMYQGGIADVATLHFDRDVSKTEGAWRPVRQPWEHAYCSGVPVGNNNEPIGPGASVASENDPVRLNAAAVATYVANIPFYVYHSRAGVRGDQPYPDMAGLDAFRAVTRFVPPDLPSWTRKNAHWADSPFRFYAADDQGVLHADTMWPDHGGGAQSGVVRAYAGVSGDRFFVFPMGLKGSVTYEPRRDVEYDVIDPVSGAVVAHEVVNAGVRKQLAGTGAWVLSGRYR